MVYFWSETVQRARKWHICDCCGEAIEVGQWYRRELYGRAGGGMLTLNYHYDDPDCEWPDDDPDGGCRVELHEEGDVQDKNHLPSPILFSKY